MYIYKSLALVSIVLIIPKYILICIIHVNLIFPALLQDMEGLRGQLEGELDSISLKRIMVQIQDKLISTQEIGDDKLQIVQHILDIIENRQRQLELDSKNLGG